jgi:putative zinc finger/helix-turn-helix YgiT family protein
MSKPKISLCTECGAELEFEIQNCPYPESGLSNVVLYGVEVADCPACRNREIRVPHVARIHQAIAQAIANSPSPLTGEQVRFLRKHLGLTGEELGRFLHTDKTKISKWERGEDPVGAASDRLIRLLVASLDAQLRPAVKAIAEHLPLIADKAPKGQTLCVDTRTLQASFISANRAA